MKTSKQLLGIVALLLLTAMGVNAQTPNQTVTQGTVKNYHVNNDHQPDYTLGWEVTGTNNTLTPAIGTSTKVTWSAVPGIYTLTMTETNTAGGCTYLNPWIVEILGKPILQFTAATSSLCADNAQSLTLAYKFEDGTNITAAANPSYFPFTVSYTIVDPLTSLNETRVLTVTTEADLLIYLSATDRIDRDPYSVSRPLTATLTNNATITSGSLNIELGANTANVNAIYDVPEINAIIAD